MLGLLSIPGRLLGLFVGLCLWLFTRPGGWAVVCVLVLVASEYYTDFLGIGGRP
ncbi:hypothetical protein [Celeribacter sp.]|uniref:hypothetical protein n=1 Tax=Celeribacter sp. TaxID=1890673 RepID=UPI003A935F73